MLPPRDPPNRKLKNSDFSVSRGANSNRDFGLILICTGEFESLDLVDFGGADFLVKYFVWCQLHMKGQICNHSRMHVTINLYQKSNTQNRIRSQVQGDEDA